MRKFHVVVEITIDDEQIKELYPDFDLYYDDMEHFIESIYSSMETDTEDSLETLGYRVIVQENLTLYVIGNNAN